MCWKILLDILWQSISKLNVCFFFGWYTFHAGIFIALNKFAQEKRYLLSVFKKEYIVYVLLKMYIDTFGCSPNTLKLHKFLENLLWGNMNHHIVVLFTEANCKLENFNSMIPASKPISITSSHMTHILWDNLNCCSCTSFPFRRICIEKRRRVPFKGLLCVSLSPSIYRFCMWKWWKIYKIQLE